MSNEYDSIISEDRQRSQREAALATTVNPDDAARAQTLSEATDVPAPAILGNLDDFERQYKRHLSTGLLQNNPYLQAYVNGNPMAAKISSDDLGQLDAVSQATLKWRVPTILGEAAKGFYEGLETQRKLGEGLIQPRTEDIEFEKNYPAVARELKGVVGAGAELFDLFINRPFAAVLGGVAGGSKEAYMQAGGAEAGAERFARDIKGMAEMQMMGLGAHKVKPPEVRIDPKIVEAYKAAKPWLDRGEEPPVGVNPLIDKLKEEQKIGRAHV